MNRKTIDAIFSTFAAANPNPKTELEYINPFTLLVSIVLSAQATDVSVNKATQPLYAVADNPHAMTMLGEEGIKRYIRTIGLYNAKAKNVHLLSKKLWEEYGGEIPATREALEKLPGVGRKTASVWLNCVHGAPTIAVDTHVFRVANRTGLCRTANPLQTELALEKAVPAKWKAHAHHWLILHGRYVCKARKPECAICPIYQWCEYAYKTA